MLPSNQATAKKAKRGKLSLAACLLLARSVMAQSTCKLLLEFKRCSHNLRIGRAKLDREKRHGRSITHGGR